MKIQKTYLRWLPKKNCASIEATLKQMDLFNKTRYSRKKELNDSLLFEAAKEAYEKRKVFYVTIQDEYENPFCSIEAHDTVFNIEFLDKLKRRYLRYRFRQQDNDRLFLRGADFFEFEGKNDKIIKQTIFSFSTEGQLTITTFDYKTKEKSINKSKKLIDVSMLWSNYPKFGEYDDLVKIERLPKDISDAL